MRRFVNEHRLTTAIVVLVMLISLVVGCCFSQKSTEEITRTIVKESRRQTQLKEKMLYRFSDSPKVYWSPVLTDEDSRLLTIFRHVKEEILFDESMGCNHEDDVAVLREDQMSHAWTERSAIEQGESKVLMEIRESCSR